jgi:predicted kinase
MRKIILTKGLPGSGKTTWAKRYQQDNQNTVLINKDDLRGMLHQNVFSKGREAFVIEIRNAIVIRALQEGHDVIIHDTNLAPKHEAAMQEMTKLPEFKGKVEVVIEDFTHIPLETCIKQDLKRHSSVGEKVIRQMYNQFLVPPPASIEYVIGLPNAIVCDIDGTLALFGDANPYDRNFLEDRLNIPVANILIAIRRNFNQSIILVSGRKDKFLEQTHEWLKRNKVPYDRLYMRKTLPEGELDPKDVIVKEEIYNEYLKGKFNVLFVLDDRNQVVDFWRSQGLTCLQVAAGDF